MPIEIKDLKAELPRRERILNFLKENKGRAYKLKEISEALKLHPANVSAIMNTLCLKGKVIHTNLYWHYNVANGETSRR